MLGIARRKAEELRLGNIHFVEGNAVALAFPDRSFDLVLNMDRAISFCGPEAERALFGSCRVTRKKLIITVANRAGMVPIWTAASLEVA
jgi:ubiquinone/menaquinone biosynthesis C-methylase UbiE